MRLRRIGMALTALALTGLVVPFAPIAAAQQNQSPPGLGRNDGVYRLQAEDVVRIQVFGQPQIGADVPVARDGNISAPFVGTVRAFGKTTAELEADLYELYVKRLKLRNPIVSVTISQFRQLRASVGGFVTRPGLYPVRDGDTLISLLTQGGGPIPDRADLRRATLRRAGTSELIPIDLYAMLIRGDTSQNYEIQDGDELNVPEETINRIVVLGTVARPGFYPYKEPMTLADAIALAGGEIPRRSRFSRTEIVRRQVGDPSKYVRIRADFVAFVKRGDSTQNVVLQPGDTIFVPETNTPDLNQVNGIVNTIFVLDSLGGLLGFRFRR